MHMTVNILILYILIFAVSENVISVSVMPGIKLKEVELFGILVFIYFLISIVASVLINYITEKEKEHMLHLLGNAFTTIKYSEFIELNNEFIEKSEKLKIFKDDCDKKNKELHMLNMKIDKYKNEQLGFETDRLEVTAELEEDIDFYQVVSNNLNAFIWVTNYEGEIVYINDLLVKMLENSGNSQQKCVVKTIYDILKINEAQLELFRTRNFNQVIMHYCNEKSFSGKSIRIFEEDKIKYILFSTDVSNEEKIMLSNYLKRSRDLHFISEISKLTSSQLSMENTLQDIADKIAFIGNFDTCSIRLAVNNETLQIKALSGYTHDFVLGSIVKVNEEYFHTHMGYSYREKKIMLINSLEDMKFDDAVIQKIIESGRKVAYIPLSNYNRTIGILSLLSEYDFDSEMLILLESISINVTIALEKLLLYEQLKSNYFQTVEAFITASELKTDKINGHSRRVAEICKVIAEKLYLTQQEIDELYIAGLLHDIGKLAFSENSVEYYFDIEKHGEIGREMVARVGLTEEILDGIEYHHLDFNLQNCDDESITEQPYYAQIIRVANDFDLYMNYDRKNIAQLDFVESMKVHIGTHYSPQFMRIINDVLSQENNTLIKLYLDEVFYE